MTTLSTAEAAAMVGLTPASFRAAMARARKQGHDARRAGPDARTPAWDEAALLAWHAARPGRGRWRTQPCDPCVTDNVAYRCATH